MPAKRKFDHERAREMRTEGMLLKDIAAHLGVTSSAVARVVSEKERESRRRYAEHLKTAGRCDDCGGVMNKMARYHGSRRCRKCASLARATSVRPHTLRCAVCREWKPDTEFHNNPRNIARRGRSNDCRPCATTARRLRRQRARQ